MAGHTNTVHALLQSGLQQRKHGVRVPATVDAKDKVRGALLSLMPRTLALLLSLSSLALFLGFILACRV